MAAEDYVKGLLIGGLLGAAIGILYAPKSGREVREDILQSAEELLEKAKCRYEEAYREIENLADHEKGRIVGSTERLKKAIDAGVETFKKEKTGAIQA